MNLNEAMRKVAALLKLAERGGTPEEAATAAAKAQEIITKYRLDINDLNFDANTAQEDKEEVKDFGYRDPLDNVKYGNYRESWTVRLASTVAYYNQCVVRYAKTGDKGKDVVIRVIGRPSDVAATRYLYGYFRHQIERLMSEQCKGNSSTYKGEFCSGCIETLDGKMEAQHKATVEEVKAEHAHNPHALVRVNNAVARIDKRREDVDDYLMRGTYEAVARRCDLTVEQAKAFWKFRDAKALFATEEEFEAGKERYDAYLKELSKHSGGGGGRGFSGAGARTTTGGREHGRKAGESIRMTGAKGSLGSGTKKIGGGHS